MRTLLFLAHIVRAALAFGLILIAAGSLLQSFGLALLASSLGLAA